MKKISRVLLLCLISVPVFAQNTEADDTVSTQASAPADRGPRAIIDALIRERSDAPVVMPQQAPDVVPLNDRVGMPASAVDLDPTVIGVLPGEPLPKLRREGSFIIERPGRLVSVENGLYWVFIFDKIDSQPDLRPMIVHPCQRLASMQDAMEQRDGNLAFTLTGQVYAYHGANFLMPTAITGSRSLNSITADQALAQSTEPEPDTETATPTAPAAGPNADARDVMDNLFAERGEPVERPEPRSTRSAITGNSGAGSSAPSGIAPSADGPELRREGEYLVGRAGRLIRGGGGVGSVMFAFEADGPDSEEPPMIVLPGKVLTMMERSVSERGDQVVFIVSGRVYTYRGTNYMLPTTVKQEANWGNLSQ